MHIWKLQPSPRWKNWVITLASEHGLFGLSEEGDGAGGTAWEASQKHRTICRALPYSSVPSTNLSERKEHSNNERSSRIKWELKMHSRCFFLLPVKGESDNHGRRKVRNVIEIGRYIKGTEKKQRKIDRKTLKDKYSMLLICIKKIVLFSPPIIFISNKICNEV